jgi:hypothetical protein
VTGTSTGTTFEPVNPRITHAQVEIEAALTGGGRYSLVRQLTAQILRITARPAR